MKASRFFASLLLSLFATLACAEVPELFPEDGSERVGRWYFSEDNIHFRDAARWKEIVSIANQHGFVLQSLGRAYEWVQDIVLFDVQGAFVAQAPYPSNDEDSVWGLTRGVFNEDGGLLRISSAEASAQLGVSSHSMSSTFVEGGGLITGRNARGEAYAIITSSTVTRAQAFSKRSRNEIDEKEARRRIALDLRVVPNRLYVIHSARHLDLFMLALPNGKILIDDPTQVPATLLGLLETAPLNERPKLERILKFYRDGHVQYYDLDAYGSVAGKPMGPAIFPVDDHDLYLLELAVQSLENDFEVIRVAGIFQDWPEKRMREDRINFYNGFQGTDKAGAHWLVTNEAKGLEHLEKYWQEVMRKYSDAVDVKVYFPGTYSSGAGIDCSGAPAP